jgi:anti-sigma regulatory factor (Ser/Thr protein kinase)
VCTIRTADGGGLVDTMTQSDLGHSLDIGKSLTELARVRDWATSLLAGLDGETLTDVLLVLDELTSNALVHADEPYQIRIRQEPHEVHLEVDDASPARAAPRTPARDGGRGLHLITACTSAWGQQTRTAGKTVWARLALPAA